MFMDLNKIQVISLQKIFLIQVLVRMTQSMLNLVLIGQPRMMGWDAPFMQILCRNTAKNLATQRLVEEVSFICCLMVKNKTILIQQYYML